MIHHYTDLHAAISITTNSQIWLTDYRFLNDKEEYTTGYEVVLKALENYHDAEGIYPKEFMDDIGQSLDFIRDEKFKILKRNNIFVSSFSATPDLLGQWRNYGKYCLELDEALFRDEDVVILQCHYLHDAGDAQDYATMLINDVIFPRSLEIWERDRTWLTLELSLLIDIYALSFKHEAFHDENEIRFVISCNIDDERISFRCRGNILIPYIPVLFDPHLLKSISIGPINNQELACESLQMFADKTSKKVSHATKRNYELEVNYSDLPYRDI